MFVPQPVCQRQSYGFQSMAGEWGRGTVALSSCGVCGITPGILEILLLKSVHCGSFVVS